MTIPHRQGHTVCYIALFYGKIIAGASLRKAGVPAISTKIAIKEVCMPMVNCAYCGHALNREQDLGLPDRHTRADHIHLQPDSKFPPYSLRCRCGHYTINLVSALDASQRYEPESESWTAS